MKKTTLLYAGKAKSVYRTEDPERLILAFRDDTSAFDGKKKEALARKGRVNNQFNAYVMEKLGAADIATHFVERLSATESVVLNLDMLPLECVVRNRAAGSLVRRLGVTEGQALDPPVFEFFLKDDDLGDPMVNESHIATFGWATEQQVVRMKELTLAVNAVLTDLFAQGNLTLVDYKLEFGMVGGSLVLGDEFSPDGCRLWDRDTGEKMDKDRFRQSLGNVIESYEEVGRRIGIDFE